MSEWISVKDRLPEMKESWKDGPLRSDYVLVCAGYSAFVGHLNQTLKRRETKWYSHRGVEPGITHWMPLPDPPAKDKP